jgi:pyruvate-formate lyase-activating enzyme
VLDPDPPARQLRLSEEVLAGIRDAVPFLTGVTVTGGEATLQSGFVRELFTELAADPVTARLTRFIDSQAERRDLAALLWSSTER